MQFIKILNWEKFQHYKDRNPPWIKLHNQLLENYQFRCLQNDSKLLLILLWLVKSRLDGDIPADNTYLKELTGYKGKINLKPLIDNKLIECYQDASKLIAECYQDAITEGETEGEQRQRRDRERYMVDFVVFWSVYPKKIGKGAAYKSWRKLKPSTELQEKMLQAVEQQKKSDQWLKDNGQFIPNPDTWLNQTRWDDELPHKQTVSEMIDELERSKQCKTQNNS